MQAQAYVEAGAPEPGFPLIDEALELGGPNDETSPFFWIARGDLSLLGLEPETGAAAEAYERAYEIATRFGARMLRLRAAARLARMAPDAERAGRIEALRAVHTTFTEGQSTPDLLEAAELLA